MKIDSLDMLHAKLKWLQKNAGLLSHNIANADLQSEPRVELEPFHEIMKGQDPKNFKIEAKHINKGSPETPREQEIMDLAKTSVEHESVVNTLKLYYQTLKSIVSNANGGM